MKRLNHSLLVLLMTFLFQNVTATDVDWREKADASCDALICHYWGAGFPGCRQQFTFNGLADTPHSKFEWWWQAHAMDVVVDAYQRTGDSRYLDMYDLWFRGIVDSNYEHWPEDEWRNESVDDTEWVVITLIRMYETSGRKEYLLRARQSYDRYVITTWGPEDEAPWYGGISWSTNPRIPKTKNACSNGPAGIIAAMLARNAEVFKGDGGRQKEDYLNDLRKIYEWECEHLLDKTTGAVFDNMGKNHLDKKVHSYNPGTFIAMAVDMYNLTGDEDCLAKAQLVADYVKANLVDDKTGLMNVVSRRKNGGDQGLFHGIFFRYFHRLVVHPDLPEAKRDEYRRFLTDNAQMAVSNLDESVMLFSSDWNGAKATEAKGVPLTPHVSGSTLMAVMALMVP